MAIQHLCRLGETIQHLFYVNEAIQVLFQINEAIQHMFQARLGPYGVGNFCAENSGHPLSWLSSAARPETNSIVVT